MKNKNDLLLERHEDLVNVLIRCRIKIEERNDPTVLDIMTDMRALPGVVTVRQTLRVSDIMSSEGHRILELNVSYIEKFIEDKDKLMAVLKSLKKIEGVELIKVIEHDSDLITLQLQKQTIIV